MRDPDSVEECMIGQKNEQLERATFTTKFAFVTRHDLDLGSRGDLDRHHSWFRLVPEQQPIAIELGAYFLILIHRLSQIGLSLTDLIGTMVGSPEDKLVFATSYITSHLPIDGELATASSEELSSMASYNCGRSMSFGTLFPEGARSAKSSHLAPKSCQSVRKWASLWQNRCYN
jgi:hypothetical protein